MIHIIYIGIGGFFGAISRYLISRFLNNIIGALPLGTLVVNVAGSFVLGFIVYSVSYGKSIPVNLRDMITIGFIGALTTMSTLSYESFRLAELNELIISILNIILNIVLCLLAVYLGKELSLLINK